MVVDQAARLRAESLDPEVFMMAALLHDIGKPAVSKLQEGTIITYGHDIKGAELAGQVSRCFGQQRKREQEGCRTGKGTHAAGAAL